MDYKHKQLEQDLVCVKQRTYRAWRPPVESCRRSCVIGCRAVGEIDRPDFSRACEFRKHADRGARPRRRAMLVFPLPKLPDLDSVGAIQSLLKASAAAEENKALLETERSKALANLNRVLSIVHKDSGDFKPLHECHAKISELRNAVSSVAWPHRHPESESIVALQHPSHSLVTFVENLDTLDDDKMDRSLKPRSPRITGRRCLSPPHAAS